MMSGIVGRALREHRGPLRRSALAGGVVALASIGLAMSSAWLIARSAQRPAILSLTVPMGLVQLFALGKAAGRYVERTSTHRAALGVMGSIRYHLARQLLPLLPAGLGPRSAEVVDVALSDVERVQDLLVVLAGPLLTSVVAGLLTVAVDAGVEWRAGLVVVAALIVSVVVVPVLAWKAGKKTQRELGSARAELRALWSDVASAGDEMIFGGQRQPVAERLDRLEDALDTASRRHATLVGMVQGTMTLLAGVTVLVTVLVARSDVSHHHLAAVLVAVPTLGAVAALEFASAATPSFLSLQRHRDAVERLDRFESMVPPVAEPAEVSTAVSPSSDLTGHGLSVSVGGGTVLQRASFAITRGDVVVLRGGSGAGKTSLGYVLAKFLDPSAGELQLGGITYGVLRGTDVRTNVAHVGDSPFVFTTTLAENVRLARPKAKDEEVVIACLAAGLGPFMERRNGVTTMLGGATYGLSGGEQRRVGIARALLAQRPVTVLDEPTEGLDFESAREVLAAVVESARERALILITHRDLDVPGTTQAWELAGGVMRVGRLINGRHEAE